MDTGERDVRYVEAEGFYCGVHAVATDDYEAELGARFSRLIELMKHDAVDSIRTAEARQAELSRRQEEAQSLWSRIRSRTDGMPPSVVMPLVAVIVVGLSVWGETILLAPMMDGLGIANRLSQLISAVTFVLVGARGCRTYS